MSPLRWILTMLALFIGSWILFLAVLAVLAIVGSMLWEAGC